MKKILSAALVLLLIFSCVPFAFAALSLNDEFEERVPASGTTFNDLYTVFCKDLTRDQVLCIQNQDPERADHTWYNEASRENIYEWLVSNEAGSIQAAGYLENAAKRDINYLFREVVCLHRHGELIKMSVFYTQDGRYVGNIKYDMTNDYATPSHRCPPYFAPRKHAVVLE